MISNNTPSKDLSKVYAEWLSKIPWTFYGHFTTLDTLKGSPKYTEKWKGIVKPEMKIPDFLVIEHWKRTVRQVNIDLYGKRYIRKHKGISWVMGIETNLAGYHKHIHVVMFGEGLWRYHRNCIRGLWESAGLRTGMSRLEGYNWDRFEKRGLFYLVKHQVKWGNVVEFIQPRHVDLFLGKDAFWWRKGQGRELFKELNDLDMINIGLPSDKVSKGGQLKFTGPTQYICFGHCSKLNKNLKKSREKFEQHPEQNNSVNPVNYLPYTFK